MRIVFSEEGDVRETIHEKGDPDFLVGAVVFVDLAGQTHGAVATFRNEAVATSRLLLLGALQILTLGASDISTIVSKEIVAPGADDGQKR